MTSSLPWRTFTLLALLVLGGFGYGRYSIAVNADDPLVGVIGRYLIGYLVAPLAVFDAVRQSVRLSSPEIVVRSRSMLNWWRQQTRQGWRWGWRAGLAVMAGTFLARIGLPVPPVLPTLLITLGVVIVTGLVATVIRSIVSLFALRAGPAVVAVVGVALWVIMLTLPYWIGQVDVFFAPQSILTSPVLVLFPIGVIAISGATAAIMDLYRRGELRWILRPVWVYLIAAGFAVLAQAGIGSSVATEAGVESFLDPVAAVLGGIGPGTSVRSLLFYVIVYVGFAAAWAIHFEALLAGPMSYQLIRSRTNLRWLWRSIRHWTFCAPLVSLTCLLLAAGASRLIPSAEPTSLSAVAAVHVIINGTLQLLLLLLVVTIARWAGRTVSVSLAVLAGIAGLAAIRQAGLAIPLVAGHGLTALPDSATGVVVSTALTLIVAIVVGLIATIILNRHRAFEWSLQP